MQASERLHTPTNPTKFIVKMLYQVVVGIKSQSKHSVRVAGD